jgi:hypothetical protein
VVSAGAIWIVLSHSPVDLPIVVTQARAQTPPANKQPERAAPTAPAAPAAPPAARPPAAAPQGLSVPQPEVLLLMLRSALISLDQANKTNNYSVMHALGGPLLQPQSPERLAELLNHFNNWAGTPPADEVREALAMVFDADELRGIVNNAEVPAAVREIARRMPETQQVA